SKQVDSGTVLLFDHGGMIEGQIDRVGHRFRVRQAQGEMMLPAAQGALLLPDKSAAYQAMRQRVRAGDARQRAILARWCLNHGLKDEAIREADEALRQAPDDDTIRRFVEDLRLQATLPPPPSVATKSTEIVPARHETVVNVEIPPSAQTLFTSKVQPILINACAGCHARPGVARFPLTRPSLMFGDRRATQLNLATVVDAIRSDDPGKSPLLLNALNLHGGASQPPLRDRESPAYRHLEEFVRLVTGKSASPARLPVAASSLASPLPTPQPAEEMSEPTPLPGIRVSGAAATSPAGKFAANPADSRELGTPKVSPPTMAPAPIDEFDPAEFNRRNSTVKPQTDPPRGEGRKPDSP
ncbi:MAG: hypothetical protein N2039_12405, partial [Gemmataceae bacterium]|nr:hypothetical protein [Gemmataceae bacterium]